MKFTQLPIATAILCALNPQISFAEQTADVGANLEKIEIVGIRQNRISEGATGLALEIDETPQSISVISAE
nr:hypothetical protein [Pseudoalteromonas sp.]